MSDHDDDHQDLIAEQYRFDNRGGIDGPDPIATAFADYRRPPADVVPRPRIEHSTAELAALADTTQTITYYDIDDDGIAKHVERAIITRPITAERNTDQ